MYEKIEYPKWKYHQELDPCVVKDAQEDEALGSEWSEAPFPEAEEVDDSSPEPTTTRRRKKKE